MNFNELMTSRYSVRKFKDMPIEREKLDLVLEAGRTAPTACNIQPQRILVIEGNKSNIEKLEKSTKYHFHAPTILLICCDDSAAWVRKFDGVSSGMADASIVTTQMMLMAAELGLGTTWVMYFDPKALIEEFHVPKNLTPIALLPIGYPADDAAPNEKLHNTRKPIAETVFYDHFPSDDRVRD